MTQEQHAPKPTTEAEDIQTLKHDILELRVNNILVPYIEAWAAEVKKDPMEDEEELVLTFCMWATEKINARRKDGRARPFQ